MVAIVFRVTFISADIVPGRENREDIYININTTGYEKCRPAERRGYIENSQMQEKAFPVYWNWEEKLMLLKRIIPITKISESKNTDT